MLTTSTIVQSKTQRFMDDNPFSKIGALGIAHSASECAKERFCIYRAVETVLLTQNTRKRCARSSPLIDRETPCLSLVIDRFDFEICLLSHRVVFLNSQMKNFVQHIEEFCYR
jgi:hypothetical protein